MLSGPVVALVSLSWPRQLSPHLSYRPLTASGRGAVAGGVAGKNKWQSHRCATLPCPLHRSAEDNEPLVQEAFTTTRLSRSPESLGYLTSRRVDHRERLETFELGDAKRTLGSRVPNRQREEVPRSEGRMQRLGVHRESGHEHLDGSVVVPVLDKAGRVVKMCRRKRGATTRAPGTPLHLPGPRQGCGAWPLWWGWRR